MEIRFFANAAYEITAGEIKLLCDPWFVPGAFDGSWYHWPPLRVRPEDFTDYTHIYISHIHPDHCDPRSLRRLPNKNVPVIILKRAEKFLRTKLISLGYTNLIELANQESCALNPQVRITMYSAFDNNVFVRDAEVPNVVDSSIVVDCDGEILFNANDNVPTDEACQEVRERHGQIHTALLPYSGVGPWPSCYRHLTFEQRKREAEVKKGKYLRRIVENAEILRPDLIIPCAGQMILGGRQVHKNEVLGIPEPEDSAKLLISAGFNTMVLEEQDKLDTASQKVKRYDPPGRGRDKKLLREEYLPLISKLPYWWELAFRIPKEEMIEPQPLLQSARNRMWYYQERYNFRNKWLVAITVEEVPQSTYFFSFNENGTVFKENTDDFFSRRNYYLHAEMPYAYLMAMLTKHCHWNNAYHGCHIDWVRQPDIFRPEMQTLLSWFHV